MCLSMILCHFRAVTKDIPQEFFSAKVKFPPGLIFSYFSRFFDSTFIKQNAESPKITPQETKRNNHPAGFIAYSPIEAFYVSRQF